MQVFWKGILDRWDFLTIRFFKGIFARGSSPERVGRGLAAGFLCSFLPLSPLRFLGAILAAFFFRGNRAVAMLPPIFFSILEFTAAATFPLALATWLWSSRAAELRELTQVLSAANLSWNWLHPLRSLDIQFTALRSALSGTGAILCAAQLLTGAFFGALSYPITVIMMSYFYDDKIRAKFLRPRPAVKEVPAFELQPFPAPAASERSFIERYCGKRAVFLSAKRVRLLVDGNQVYPEMLASIVNAQKTIELETYIFRADHFGEYFASALKAAALRGVKVRLVVDGFGSVSLTDAFYAGLTRAGVEVRVFHPLWSAWRGGMGFLQRRDHRKTLICDGQFAFVGGLNIADEYASKQEGGGGWHDIHVRLDGEAIGAALQTIFNESWMKSEPAKISPTLALPPEDLRAAAESLEKYLEGRHTAARIVKYSSGAVPTRILSNHELLERVRIKRAYLRAVRAAKHYILLENAFFIPDRGFLRALYKARKRGVLIAVVVAMRSDVQIAAMASRALYDEMLARGIRLFEYSRNMVHAKVAVIDDCWTIVSSYNLNQRSLLHDLEVGALFFDENFAKAMRGQILEDIRGSNEITLTLHRSRKWSTALWESFWYLFRHWL